MTTLPHLTIDDLTRFDRRSGPAERGYGTLVAPQGHLPLVAMDVRAELTGLVSSVSIRQTFRNTHRVPVEATYIFPLPDRAAVTDFAVTFGDRRIVGTLQERQAARQAYDQAIESGLRAAIVEEERPDIFTSRVGNLAPGEQAIVELTLAGRLPCEDGEATFRFPLVVAPRYLPGALLPGDSVGDGFALDTDAVPDASRITPPILLPGVANPVRLSLSATVDPAGLDISDLRSSLHAVAVSGALPDPVTLEIRPDERLDRDFVLRSRVGGQSVGAVLSATAVPDPDGDEGTFFVTLVPPAAGATSADRDVVVVLDRSGSMEGWKMAAARRAAARLVDSLTSRDRFAVIAFDHAMERPPDALDGARLVAATDRSRYQAVEWLARLEPRGGTELLPALTEALAALDRDGGGRERTCVIVTDGQVGNDDQVVKAATAAGGVRLFTVGIDRSVNAGLLRRLAAASGGRCDLVESEDRLDEVMTALHRRIGQPVFERVSVELGDMEVVAGSTTPPAPADVFPGVPLVVAGRYRGQPGARATVTGHGPGGEVTLGVGVTVTGNAGAAAVWARSHLRDLEDRYVSAKSAAELDSLEAEITAVSLRHRVLCRFTAYVVVDNAGLPVSGEPHHIVQPVELPSGWSPAAIGGAGSAGPHRMAAAVGPATGAPFESRPMAEPRSSPDRLPSPSASPAVGGVPSPTGPRIRLPGRHSGGGRFRPYEQESADLDPYQARVDALLVAVDMLALDGAGPLDEAAVREAAAGARLLADDLRSVGAPDALVAAIDGLAAALLSRDGKVVAARVDELKQRRDGASVRQGWWRR